MMKITKSVRDAHAEQKEKYDRLACMVDDTIRAVKERGWHYESRVKEPESFALKLETGRYTRPQEIDDFFACTLVVENLAAIPRAQKIVLGRFGLHKRRPPSDALTAKPPDSFRFDDLRLYVKWKDQPSSRPTGLAGLVFEVQIKTFLQHAWGIATHDLTYKSDEKNWPKERIAFQVRAMLEHAETSIQEAKKLAKSSSLKKTDEFSKRVSTLIAVINKLWPAGMLPTDRKRLAENIDNLLLHVGVDSGELKSIVEAETVLGKGTQTLTLSPFSIVVQSLLNQQPDRMRDFLYGPEEGFSIFIPREVEFPPSVDRALVKNAVLD